MKKETEIEILLTVRDKDVSKNELRTRFGSQAVTYLENLGKIVTIASGDVISRNKDAINSKIEQLQEEIEDERINTIRKRRDIYITRTIAITALLISLLSPILPSLYKWILKIVQSLF